MASANKRRSYIQNIIDENRNHLESCDDIFASLMNFYKNKWCKSIEICEQNCPTFLYCFNQNEASTLEEEITDAEIVNTVKNLCNNKASGIDGITSSFFSGYWDIVRPDTIAAIKSLLQSGY